MACDEVVISLPLLLPNSGRILEYSDTSNCGDLVYNFGILLLDFFNNKYIEVLYFYLQVQTQIMVYGYCCHNIFLDQKIILMSQFDLKIDGFVEFLPLLLIF